MRLSIAAANRTAIAVLAALLAGCSNTTPGLQTLPLGSSGVAQSVARERSGRDAAVQFAYVTNFGSKNVSAYSVTVDGALAPLAGPPVKAGTEPYGIAVDPTGKFAYVANLGSNNVSAYTIDVTSGALKKVKGSPFAGGSNPISIAVEPSGKFAYVANIGSHNVSAYAIDANSGALTPVGGSPFQAGHEPFAVAVDPLGKFAYVTNFGSNNVSAYAIDAASGALTPVKGSPFAAGINPFGVAVHPSGKFAYVASNGSNNLYGFAIDAATGALRSLPGSPFPNTGANAEDIVVAPSGRFAYVPNSFGTSPSTVSAYAIDSARGTLTPVVDSPFKDAGSTPRYGAVDSTSKFAYIVNNGSNNVSAYSITASGALRKVKGSPFAAGTYPAGMSVCRVVAGKCIPPPL